MTLRGIRGATCLSANDADEMREAVSELLGAVMERNALTADDIISIILTGTPDLTCAFPAAGARDFGLRGGQAKLFGWRRLGVQQQNFGGESLAI